MALEQIFLKIKSEIKNLHIKTSQALKIVLNDRRYEFIVC